MSNTNRTSKQVIDIHKLLTHRDVILYRQTEAEARQTRVLGSTLRDSRMRWGYSRRVLADLLDIDVELLIAVENGYGSPEIATELLHQSELVTQQQKPQTSSNDGTPSEG
jgi:hypothetical protein